MGFELFYSWQMMVLTFFKKRMTHGVSLETNMLDLSFFYEISSVQMDIIIFPSSWTFKPLVRKKIGFSLWPMQLIQIM
jgi:hypothetical protein